MFLKLFSGKKYFYPLIASEINLCIVAQCFKATLNFFVLIINEAKRQHQMLDIIRGKLQNVFFQATFGYTLKYIAVTFLVWVNIGRLIFRFNCGWDTI